MEGDAGGNKDEIENISHSFLVNSRPFLTLGRFLFQAEF